MNTVGEEGLSTEANIGLNNADVYIVADKFDIPPLKALAVARMTEWAQVNYLSSQFIDMAHHVLQLEHDPWPCQFVASCIVNNLPGMALDSDHVVGLDARLRSPRRGCVDDAEQSSQSFNRGTRDRPLSGKEHLAGSNQFFGPSNRYIEAANHRSSTREYSTTGSEHTYRATEGKQSAWIVGLTVRGDSEWKTQLPRDQMSALGVKSS